MPHCHDDSQTELSVKEAAEDNSAGPQRDLLGYKAPCAWDGPYYQHGTWWPTIGMATSAVVAHGSW